MKNLNFKDLVLPELPFLNISGRPPLRRFSMGDCVDHVIHGIGHISATPCFDLDSGKWLCLATFESQQEILHIAEDDLVSVPGAGLRKYGQGNEGCRMGSSRYGRKTEERESVSNGRTRIRTLNRHHLSAMDH